MKIAILYICTGKYTVFWDNFFKSCERFFFPGNENHYFVFTDGQIPITTERIHRIEQKNLGWPGNTLYRFRMFWGIREQLAAFDYIFFFNANCEFLSPVGTEFLPSHEEGIIVVQHPGFYNKTPNEFTYDRNQKSRAYIAFGEGLVYICGGINGGRADMYLSLIDSLREAIENDDKNNIIALWHDESHINKYILNHSYKLLSPSYCYPEGWNIPFEKIIMIRDKTKYGGHDALRGFQYKRRSLPTKMKGKIRKVRQYIAKAIGACLVLAFFIKARKSVVVEIMGGLGNQMFQYALGKAIAYHSGTRLYLDLLNYKYDNKRDFLLDNFPAVDYSKFPYGKLFRKGLPIIQKVSKKLRLDVFTQHREFNFAYLPEVKSTCLPVYLSGWWQNEQYFSDIESVIRKYFTFPDFSCRDAENTAAKINASPCPISVHVRRGDYVEDKITNSYHGMCSPEYYEKAIKTITEKFSGKKIELFLFSDDPEWVRNNFNTFGHPSVTVDIPQHKEAPYQDMHLMSLCEHHIIANSSFSWWGAWLSTGNGTVVAPKQWFLDETVKHYNPSPSSWIKI